MCVQRYEKRETRNGLNLVPSTAPKNKIHDIDVYIYHAIVFYRVLSRCRQPPRSGNEKHEGERKRGMGELEGGREVRKSKWEA